MGNSGPACRVTRPKKKKNRQLTVGPLVHAISVHELSPPARSRGWPPHYFGPESQAELSVTRDVGTACDPLWDGEPLKVPSPKPPPHCLPSTLGKCGSEKCLQLCFKLGRKRKVIFTWYFIPMATAPVSPSVWYSDSTSSALPTIPQRLPFALPASPAPKSLLMVPFNLEVPQVLPLHRWGSLLAA